ncbi:MAG: substrate-binding domain-containing protein [Christensenellales bacterium]|jgi:ribose transport system substrate-binding protein
MVKKKIIVSLIAVILVMCFVLAGCGAPAPEKETAESSTTTADVDTPKVSDKAPEPAKAKDPADMKFGAVHMSLANPHFVLWSEGLNEVISEKGGTLIEADSQFDPNLQLQQVEDMIQQQCDVILISPVDSQGILTAIQSCDNAGIPVFIMDVRAADETLVTCTVCTDNVMAGELLAQAMVDECGEDIKAAIIDLSISDTVRNRTEGFFNIMDKYPGVEVVCRQDADPSSEAALPVMENFLQSNPEIQAVFCINDLQGLGALAACEAAQRTDIKIFSVDGQQIAYQEIVKGKNYIGTSAQFPYEMGKLAAEQLYKIANGESVEKIIFYESKWINKDIVEDYIVKE